MATITVSSNPAAIIAADTADNMIAFTAPAAAIGAPVAYVYLKVTTGSIKFNVGGPVVAASPSYGPTDVIPPLSVRPGVADLYFKAATVSDAFNLSV